MKPDLFSFVDRFFGTLNFRGGAPSRLRLWCYALLGAALAAMQLNTGGFEAAIHPDAGWSLLSQHAAQRGWVFGRDVMTNVGPLAYWHLPSHEAAIDPWLLLFQAGLGCLTVLALDSLGRGWPSWLRVLLLCWLPLASLSNVASGNMPPKIEILLPGLCLACHEVWLRTASDASRLRRIQTWLLRWGIPLWMALIVCIKFSFVLLWGACVALLLGRLLWRRHWRKTVAFVTWSLTALLTVWVLCGQPLAALPTYWWHNLMLGRDYALTTAVAPSGKVLTTALLLLLLLLVVAVLLLRARQYGSVCLLVLVNGLSWKHGMTQADGLHPLFFMMPVPFWALWASQQLRWQTWRLPGYLIAVALVLALLGRASLATPGQMPWEYAVSQRFIHLPDTLSVVWHAVVNAEDVRPKTALPTEPLLPEITRQLNGATVDVLGHNQSVALLAGWNYSPRPYFQGFITTGQDAMQTNAAWLRNKAPDYLVWRSGAYFLNQYPFANDNLLLRQVLNSYRPVLQENDFLLMQRFRATDQALPLKLVQEFPLKASDGLLLSLNGLRQQPVFISVEISHSWLGKLLGMLYQFPRWQAVATIQDPAFAQSRQEPADQTFDMAFQVESHSWRTPVMVQPFATADGKVAWFWDRNQPHATLLQLGLSTTQPWAFRDDGVLRVYVPAQ